MYYSGIKPFSTENGPGVRVSLFVSGCRNACEGCFQPETWDFQHGEPFDEAARQQVMDDLAPDYIAGLTLLGGDPFEPENQADLIDFIRTVKQTYPDKTIWAFTGYHIDDELAEGGKNHTDVTDEFLGYMDVVVDGPFILEKKSLMLPYRGSENQRIILMDETRKSGEIVLSPLMDKRG